MQNGRNKYNKRKFWLMSFFIFGAFILSACGQKSAEAGYRQITQEEAGKMMESEGVVIVDVRTEEEYKSGHILGAICIPVEDIRENPPEELPDKDQTILIYCRSGRRSKIAAEKLSAMGYTNIYEFGGIIDWTGEVVKEETAAGAASEEAGTDELTAGTAPEEADTEETTAGTAPEEAGTDKPPVKEEESMLLPTLLFQGHGSVRIVTAEDKVIYIDPFAGDGYDLPADLILITHSHKDHTQTDLIKKQNENCRIITQKEALEGGTHQSFDLGYVTVEAVEAGYNKNHDVNNCVGYVLTFSNGARVYLSGDTSKTPQMEKLEDIDYAFFCCDGVYNMDTSEASECAKLVGATHSIPYHMIPADPQNNFDRTIAESFEAEGRIIMKPGEELKLEK